MTAHIGGGGRRREINVAPRAGPEVFNLLETLGGEVVELRKENGEREREIWTKTAHNNYYYNTSHKHTIIIIARTSRVPRWGADSGRFCVFVSLAPESRFGSSERTERLRDSHAAPRSQQLLSVVSCVVTCDF